MLYLSLTIVIFTNLTIVAFLQLKTELESIFCKCSDCKRAVQLLVFPRIVSVPYILVTIATSEPVLAIKIV